MSSLRDLAAAAYKREEEQKKDAYQASKIKAFETITGTKPDSFDEDYLYKDDLKFVIVWGPHLAKRGGFAEAFTNHPALIAIGECSCEQEIHSNKLFSLVELGEFLQNKGFHCGNRVGQACCLLGIPKDGVNND